METYLFFPSGDEKKEFKSYYVVWKHDIKKVFNPGKNEFKSYYVVWKLCEKTHHAKYMLCLNRTM